MATQITNFGRLEEELYRAPTFETFYKSPHAQTLGDNIATRWQQADIVSFDVFDTILLRDHRSELERFVDMAAEFVRQAKEYDSGFPHTVRACATARIFAASDAYQMTPERAGCREGKHSDILRSALATLGLTDDPFFRFWLEAEFSTEVKQLRVDPFIETLITAAKDAGKTVICISDMFYSASLIGRLMAECGVDTSRIDKVFSSADSVLNKRSGKIYSLVCEELETTPDRILHIGDSLGSDFAAAINAGLQAVHLPIPKDMMRQRYDSHRETLERVFGGMTELLPISTPEL